MIKKLIFLVLFTNILFMSESCIKSASFSPTGSPSGISYGTEQNPSAGKSDGQKFQSKCAPNTPSNGAKTRISDGFEVFNNATTPGGQSEVFLLTKFKNLGKEAACTGTFVSDHLILTAAHCFLDPKDKVIIISANCIDINMGLENLPAETISKTSQIKMNEFYVNYCSNTEEKNRDQGVCAIGDLALVRSVKSASDLGVRVANVTTKKPSEGTPVNLIGYGTISDTDKSEIFKKTSGMAQVASLSAEEITSTNNTNVSWPGIKAKKIGELFEKGDVANRYFQNIPNWISSLVFLNATNTDFSGLCFGDSGSGIFVKVANTGDIVEDYAVAAVAHAISAPANSKNQACSEKKSFNISIAEYQDWINTNMNILDAGASLKIKNKESTTSSLVPPINPEVSDPSLVPLEESSVEH